MKKINFIVDEQLLNDKPHDECGVVGVYGNPQAARLTYFCLHALQHRGQEGSGIVTSDYDEKTGKYKFHAIKDFGLVSDIFKDDKLFSDVLIGNSAIGHNRYSTAGSATNKFNVQPLVVNYKMGNMALCHNGNLTNFREIRQRLQNEGTIFQTTSDTETILHLAAKSQKPGQVEQIIDALNQVEGAFSIAILTDDKLIVARDPHGWRPLALGKVGDSFIVASETCAFDIIDATYIRDIEPGEVAVFDRDSVKTNKPTSYRLSKSNGKHHHCIFEYIYFSRPDSQIFGENVDKVRRKLGKNLALQAPVPSDEDGEIVIVINVPDSSNTATIGYVSASQKQGLKTKYEIGLIRNHYVGRTFIQPAQEMRQVGVKAKFNTVKGVLKDRKVVIVDDSIVRGTTSKQLVKLVRAAGVKEIHFRVTSPPIRYPCHYGIDFPDPKELIANRCDGDVEKIRQELGVDTLEYLSLDRLLESVPHAKGQDYCTACFSGKYPTAVTTGGKKEEYEL
ncbi:MAG: amidophosphoribosyltransferase [Bacteroidota bacterium]